MNAIAAPSDSESNTALQGYLRQVHRYKNSKWGEENSGFLRREDEMHPTNFIELNERVDERFPREAPLPGGGRFTVAPMAASDWPYVEQFLQATPEEEQRFFRHDVRQAGLVEQWCAELDYRHVLPLLAWRDDVVAADVTLTRESGIWTSHLGRVRILVHPSYRGQGLGSWMMDEVAETAALLGLHKLVVECAAQQRGFIGFLSSKGFREAGRLPDFIRDREGRLHDMVLMARTLPSQAEG